MVALNLAAGTEADTGTSSPAEFFFDANVAGNVTVMTQRPSQEFVTSVTVVHDGLVGTNATAFLHEALSFAPGDTMSIEVAYSGLQTDLVSPNQLEMLLFSISIDGGAEYPVKQERIEQPSNAGVHKVTWTIPWDTRLVSGDGATAVLIVRSSADITRQFTTRRFGLKMFTENDGIFLSPAANERVLTDTQYALRWHAHLLEVYEPLFFGSQGGHTRRSKHCHFTVVAEEVSADGVVTQSVSVDLTPYLVQGADGSDLGNNGVAHVKFPAHLAGLGDRFYLWAHSATHLHVGGWSSGYFTLHPHSTSTTSRVLMKVLLPGEKRDKSAFLMSAASVERSNGPSEVSKLALLHTAHVDAPGSDTVLCSSIQVGGSGMEGSAGING